MATTQRHRGGPKSLCVVGRRGEVHVVLNVEIDTGKVTEIVSEQAVARREAWTGVVNRIYDPTVLVTVSGFTEMYDTNQAVIRAYDLTDSGRELSRHVFPTGPTIGSVSVGTGSTPAVFPDGQRLAIGAGDVKSSVLGVDLRSGNYFHMNAPAHGVHGMAGRTTDDIALSPDGIRFVLAESGSGSDLLLRDTITQQWISQLTLDQDLIAPNSVFSRDGSHLATIGFYTPPGAGRGGPFLHQLVLHDLSALDDLSE